MILFFVFVFFDRTINLMSFPDQDIKRLGVRLWLVRGMELIVSTGLSCFDKVSAPCSGAW